MTVDTGAFEAIAEQVEELHEALRVSVRVIAALADEYPELANGVSTPKRHLRLVKP